MIGTVETVVGLTAMLAALVTLAMAAWGMLLERAVRDSIEKRRLSKADKLCRWRQRADAVLMVMTVIMALAGMAVAVLRLI